MIYGVGEPGYTAGIQTGGGIAYLYNNTIVGITSGFAIRSGGVVVAKNNLTDAPGEDFYGSCYTGSDFNASSDDSAPGFHSRLNQAFAFVNPSAGDYHLATSDAGARNFGLDLSVDRSILLGDDIDGARAQAAGISALMKPPAVRQRTAHPFQWRTFRRIVLRHHPGHASAGNR